MSSAYKGDPIAPLAGFVPSSSSLLRPDESGMTFSLEALRKVKNVETTKVDARIDVSSRDEPVSHVRARGASGSKREEMHVRSDHMLGLMGGAAAKGTLGNPASSAHNPNAPAWMSGNVHAFPQATPGMPGREPLPSTHVGQQPHDRHAAALPARATRASKRKAAAAGSDFEMFSNLTMERLEKAMPVVKPYLLEVSPRTFGLWLCVLVFLLVSTFLYLFLVPGQASASYYTLPPPPSALSAPVNPLRSVSGCPDTSTKDAKPGGLPSEWTDSCKAQWNGVMHFRDMAGPYVAMLPPALPGLGASAFKTVAAGEVQALNRSAPPVDDAALLALPSGGLVAAFIFRPLTAEVNASGVAETGGDPEAPKGPTDAVGTTAIAVSRLDLGSNTWTDPKVVAKFSRQALLRPTLHYAAGEDRLYLMFVFRDVDDDDSETRVGWMASTDSGRLWGQAKQNVWLTSGPTKGPWIAGGGGGITAATAADGSVEWLLAQSFVPHATVWSAGDTFAEGGLEQHYSVMKSSRDRGATWTLRGFMSRPYDVLAAPVVVRLADGTLRAFFSDRKNEAIYISDDRRDDGRFWQLWPTRTRLPSGPGGITATIAPRSGRLVLAFNNRAGGGWGGVLSLAVSEDGGATFPWVRDLEPDSAEGDAVKPAMSDGEDSLFPSSGQPGDELRRAPLAGREHFYGNPSVSSTWDGRLHVLYTYRGRAIKHVIIDEAWVMSGGTAEQKQESKSKGSPDARLSKGVFQGDEVNTAVADPKPPAEDDPRLAADPESRPLGGGVRAVPCCEAREHAEREEEMKQDQLLMNINEVGRRRT